MTITNNAKQTYELFELQNNPAMLIISDVTYKGHPVAVIAERVAKEPKEYDALGRPVGFYEPLAIIVEEGMYDDLVIPPVLTDDNVFNQENYIAAVQALPAADLIDDPQESVDMVATTLTEDIMDGMSHETFDFIVENPKDMIQRFADIRGSRKMVVVSDSIFIVGLDEGEFTWVPLNKSSIEDIPFFDLCVVINPYPLGEKYNELLMKELMIKANINKFQSVVVYLTEPSDKV